MQTNLTSLERFEAQIQVLQEGTPQGAAWEAALVRWVNAGGHPDLVKGWGWKQWPGRAKAGLPRIERGVDLIAEDRAGRLVAIQAKFRNDPDSPVKTGEVQKFVGAYRKHFPRRMLISNASSRARGIKEAVGDAEAELVLRTDLMESLFDWIASKPLPKPKVTPLPFQKEAAAAIKKHLKDGGRAQIVMACGSGKTYTTLLAMEALGSKRVLVLAPTLLLVKQLRDEWMRERKNAWATLAVCSDIGTDEGDDSTHVSPGEIGSKPTTDPAEIAVFLKSKGPYVVFGTYASSARIATAQKKAGVPAFDLVVADEAHRIAGAVGKADKEERAQRVVLDEKGIRAERRLFATATPRVYGGDKKGDGEEVVLESMDDPTRFGEEVYKLTFQQAVDLERLVPYKLLVTIVTDEEIAALIHDRKYVDVQGKQITADDLATAIAVRRAYKELGISRVISYHGNIKRARDFAQLVQEIKAPGKAPEAECVTGAMAVEDRKEALTRLANAEGPYLITNARCLTEGIDVPALDAVAFADPRRSQVDIVQAVGRAMRKPRGKSTKTTGYIILPVFLSKKELKDPETAVEGSAFAPVLQVLRALKAHDPYRATFFAKILVEEGKRPHKKGEGIDEILEVSIGKELDRALAKRLEQAVQLRAVKVSADPFERAVTELELFVSQHGHAEVPARYSTETGYNLGTFVAAQRRLFAKGELSANRVQMLEERGLTWQVLEAKWSRALELLIKFQTTHDHLAIPWDYEIDGFRLGQWAVDIRKRNSPTSRSPLDVGRKTQLDAMGFVWELGDQKWDQGFAVLEIFNAREHHCFVPNRHLESGFNLGSWVSNLRRRRAALTPDQLTKLENLGFSWHPTSERFERGFTLYADYVQSSGTNQVPVSLMWKGFPLGGWAAYLREKRRAGKLDVQIINRMNRAGFPWDLRYDGPGIYLPLLRKYVQREGNADVPQAHKEDGHPLGGWLSSQRANRAGLPPDLISELTALGFDWNPAETKWDKGIQALQAFKAREKHCDVPYKHVEQNFDLGHWVAYARSHKHPSVKGALSNERIRQLDKLGFNWSVKSSQQETAWLTGFAFLKRHVSKTGSALLARTESIEGYPLGAWVAKQRAAHRSGTLRSARAQRLEALPGWSWQVKSGPRKFSKESEDNWRLGLVALRAFYKLNRHFEVPSEHLENGFRLGRWVGQMRKLKLQLSISPLQKRRIEYLNKLGFLWNAQEVQRERAWQYGLGLLKEYIRKHGTSLVPAKSGVRGYQLGAWVAEQRVRYREGKLASSRINTLSSLPEWTWAPKQGRRRNNKI